MKKKIYLVTLNSEQIAKAKEVNGQRYRITHAIVCGRYGQTFGPEKQCRKYYEAWSYIYPNLFDGAEEILSYDFKNYDCSDLTGILMKHDDKIERTNQRKTIAQLDVESSYGKPSKEKNTSLLSDIFQLLKIFMK